MKLTWQKAHPRGASGGAMRDPRAAPPIGTVLRATTVLYLLGLLTAWWLTTRVGEEWWVATALLYVPRAVYALPLLLLIPLAAWSDRRLLAVHAGCLAFLIGPGMGWQAPGRGEALPAGATPIRVLTANVGYRGAGAAALARAVAETAPDVVVAQESRDLSALFPGWQTHHDGEHFLATRLPLLAAETHAYLPDRPHRRGARYRLRGPRGSFTLYAVHLYTPRRALQHLKALRGPGQGRAERLREAARELAENAARRSLETRATRTWVDSVTGPRIVAGDFNMPPDSPLSRRVWAGFRDAFSIAGAGFGFTFPESWPCLRIDRILASPEWRVSRTETLAGSGRDHRPVVAELWQ